MKKKIKIIDLLCLISNGEEVPKRIKISDNCYHFDIDDSDYYNDADNKATLMENIYLHNAYVWLNKETEILDEEDKDIPLIPDDELFLMQQNGADIRGFEYLDYNFKVLQEKINQVVKEFNEYRKEEK